MLVVTMRSANHRDDRVAAIAKAESLLAKDEYQAAYEALLEAEAE